MRDAKPMKVVVIGGFLGAGKTTLLLRVARAMVDAGRHVAVIENEVGKVGVDDGYLVDQGLKVREIFGGCVCCSLGANLLLTLKQLQEQVGPDVVLVEPSGVASPDTVRQTLAGFGSGLESIKLVSVFDIERFKAINHVAGPMVEATLKVADAIVINKTDLVDREQVLDLVDSLHQRRPEAAIIPMRAKEGEHLDRLLAAIDEQPTAVPPTDEPHAHDHPHDHDHDEPHHHPGSPIAEARQLELTFDPPVAGARLVEQVREILHDLARRIDEEPDAVIGHVKASLRDGGETAGLLLRTTAATRPPECDGPVPELIARVELRLNAIAYHLDPTTLARLTDAAVARLQAAPTA